MRADKAGKVDQWPLHATILAVNAHAYSACMHTAIHASNMPWMDGVLIVHSLAWCSMLEHRLLHS